MGPLRFLRPGNEYLFFFVDDFFTRFTRRFTSFTSFMRVRDSCLPDHVCETPPNSAVAPAMHQVFSRCNPKLNVGLLEGGDEDGERDAVVHLRR